jgi:hypothetical protein
MRINQVVEKTRYHILTNQGHPKTNSISQSNEKTAKIQLVFHFQSSPPPMLCNIDLSASVNRQNLLLVEHILNYDRWRS